MRFFGESRSRAHAPADKPRDAEVNGYEGERTGIVVVQRTDDGNRSWFFETPDTYGYEPKQADA